jgi:hypothetical protein
MLPMTFSHGEMAITRRVGGLRSGIFGKLSAFLDSITASLTRNLAVNERTNSGEMPSKTGRYQSRMTKVSRVAMMEWSRRISAD